MSPLHLIWLTVGLLVGGLHTAFLWLAVRRNSAWAALTGAVRLLSVALALVVAGRCGGLMPASAGWFTGFLATASYLLIRSRAT